MPLVDGKLTELVLPRKHTRVIYDNSKNWRYRVLFGGRNGAKDWSFTASVVERAVRRSTRILCTREIQNTIKDSVHRLIADTINRLGYADYFTVTEREIKCNTNDSIFLFRGLRDLNAENVKSTEGIDICIIGEAQNLTQKSFFNLDPTIRKPGSEIWIQFNPQFDDDFVYEFCVNNPPENMICEKVLYTDNPWTSPEIVAMAERMRVSDPVLYKNIWLGEPLGQGGRVFPLYSREIHEVPFDVDYLKQCDLYMAIDPHRKYYPAITWYAVTPTNAVIVYNEYPKFEDLGMWYDEARDQKAFDLSLKELASVILANDMTLSNGKRVTRTADPRFSAENPDFIRILQENGVMGWVDAPFERIETQRENLKTLMYYNPSVPLYGTNSPDWYVNAKCLNKSRAYRRHSYSEDKDKESEQHKDFIDDDRYFLSLFEGGKPRQQAEYSAPIGAIKSLAHLQLQQLPVQGYFKQQQQKK